MKFSDLLNEKQLEFIRTKNDRSWESTEEIACPFCNEVQNLDYDSVPYEDDSTVEHECYECGKTFDIHTSRTFTFSTELPDEEVYERISAQSPKEKREE